MQVIAGYQNCLQIPWRPESGEGTADISQIKLVLLGSSCDQWHAFRGPCDRTSGYCVELPVYANGIEDVLRIAEPVELGMERSQVGAVRQLYLISSRESCDHRIRATALILDFPDGAVATHLVEMAFQGHHLADEAVERPQTEIAMFPK